MPWKLPVFALGRAISTQLYAQRSTLVARSFRWRRLSTASPDSILQGARICVPTGNRHFSWRESRFCTPHVNLLVLDRRYGGDGLLEPRVSEPAAVFRDRERSAGAPATAAVV